MRTLIAAVALTLAALPAVAANEEEKRGRIDVVFCIDRSGSMSQVIETAKQKVWSIVNQVATAKPTPILRIGLIGYGSADRDIKLFPLSDDLDSVYENLMTFKTDMGGSEWVGWAIHKATEDMGWIDDKKALKIIYMVGNETARQGRPEVLYTRTAPKAISAGIMVNAIYCGNPRGAEETTWREVASLADGTYSKIDLSGGAVTIQTPMDKKLAELNRELNETYVFYGAQGLKKREKQLKQDRAATAVGGAPSAASRTVAKASKLYRNESWDLVDASKNEDFKLAEVDKETLPAELKDKTAEERKAYVEEKSRKREAIQKQVKELAGKRADYIAGEMKKRNLSQENSFDEAVRRSIRAQAEKKGFTFEK